jgi:hypothetical protein
LTHLPSLGSSRCHLVACHFFIASHNRIAERQEKPAAKPKKDAEIGYCEELLLKNRMGH